MFESENFLPNSSSEHFLNRTKFKTKINYDGLQSREIENGSMFFCIMYSVMFFFGLFTNLLVVFVFLFKKELRQYTNYFFTNLSVADLLVIIVCIPVAISDLLSPDVWNFGLVYCKLYYFIEHCVTTVSSLTIIFISLERYFAISRPLSVKILFNGQNSIFTLVSIWLVALIVSSPFLLMTEYSSVVEQCWLNLSKIRLLYVLIFNVLFIFLPTIGLAFLYIYIIINLRKHNQFFSSSSRQNGLRIHSKNSIMLKSKLNKNLASLSGSEKSKFINRDSILEIKKLESGKMKTSTFKWNKKRSRSCSFCFSGTKNNYDCRCTKSEELNVKNSNSFKTDFGVNHLHTIKNFNTKKSMNSNQVMFTRIQSSKHTYSSYNKINFTIVISLITLIFFCCQLPIRIFILWSNFRQFYYPPLLINNLESNDINIINTISDLTTTIYFFHCISNPIIYNLLSAKFRHAFLTVGITKGNCICRHLEKSNFIN